MADVILYSTPTCPDCKAIRAWLSEREIPFQERDLSDHRIMAEAKTRYGVRVAPITAIGDEFLYGTFAAQKPELIRLLG